MNTAATAWLCGTPALVRPAMRPASTTPAPPGTGIAAPISPAAMFTTNSVARLTGPPPQARHHGEQHGGDPRRDHHGDDDPYGPLAVTRGLGHVEGPGGEEYR